MSCGCVSGGLPGVIHHDFFFLFLLLNRSPFFLQKRLVTCGPVFLLRVKYFCFLDDPQVGKAKGVLKNFLIEPFVAHKQVKRSFHSYSVIIPQFFLDSLFGSDKTQMCNKQTFMNNILMGHCSGGGVLRVHLRHPRGRLRAVSP